MGKWPTEEYQFDDPYYSTIAFEKFLSANNCLNPGGEVLDIGAGLGANIYYLRQVNPNVNFLGLDYNSEKVLHGKRLLAERGLAGVDLDFGDWFNLPQEYAGRFEGIFNCHSLCCFKRIEPPLEALMALQPQWIALNSLFYEGPLDVLIHIRDHTNPALADDDPDGDFNIFSIENVKRVLNSGGYELTAVDPFFPPVQMPKPAGGARGSYTMETEIHKYTIFSGPVHLPWYFILARRLARATQ